MTVPSYLMTALRTPRPPLTERQRRGAAFAGIVGFLLVNLGWAPFAIVIVLFAAAIIVLFASAAGGTDRLPSPAGGVSDAFAGTFGLRAAAVDGILIGGCVVGALLIVLGIVLSTKILRRHGVGHPVGVTWASLAVAIVANWIVGGFVWIVVGAVTGAANGASSSAGSGLVIAVGLAVAVVFEALVGWLAWWWMAHVMRHRIPPAA